MSYGNPTQSRAKLFFNEGAPMDFASFQPPLWAATIMNAFDRPWCIAGGWALDLWLQRPTRGHGDVKVAILRDDQLLLRDFLDQGRFFLAAPGPRPRQRLRWRGQDRQMLMLPIHELLIELPGGRGHTLKVLLNEHDTHEWVYRHDGRIRTPIDNWTTPGGFGVPVIAPEIALLYKTRNPSPRDELDFHSALETLEEPRRVWLAQALSLKTPEHPWLPQLLNVCSASRQ
jgi:hypothetical protein